MKAVGDQKRCSKCKRWLPVSEYYKDKRRPDGFRMQCKGCEREYASRNADRISDYQRRYREENADRLAENRKRWEEDNRDELLAKKRDYNRRPSVIERMKVYRHRHYEENKERYKGNSIRWKAQNREKVQQYKKDWKERHPDRVTESRARYNQEHRETTIAWTRRRRARQAEVAVGEVDHKRIWKRDRGLCYLCGRSVAKNDVHYDHVIPLSRGGTHSEDNIRVTHARCNLKKGVKLVEELDLETFRS
jgi:5-methylcytosine-specific restriction endonuclease McrA